MRLFAIVLLALSSIASAADLKIIPYPRSVERLDGRLVLKGTVLIAVAWNDADDKLAASLLKDEIESATKAKARVTSGSGGTIVLPRKDAPADLGDEGYRLEAGAKNVRITAR